MGSWSGFLVFTSSMENGLLLYPPSVHKWKARREKNNNGELDDGSPQVMICLDVPASHLAAFVREHKILYFLFPSLPLCLLPFTIPHLFVTVSAHLCISFFSPLICVALFAFFIYVISLSLLPSCAVIEKKYLVFEFSFAFGISFPGPSLLSNV